MTPPWLYDLFGVVVLALAGYSVVLFAVTMAARRPAGWDVDVAHTLMGISMAGMFVAGWAFGSSVMWELIFSVLLVWFLARSALSVRQFGFHLSHFFVHAVLCVAMILMFAFPGVARDGSMGLMHMSMPMSTSPGPRLDPAIAIFLALCLFGSAIYTIGSSKRGAAHHGSHVLAYAGGGSPPAYYSKDDHSQLSIESVVTHTLGRGCKSCRDVCDHGNSPHSDGLRRSRQRSGAAAPNLAGFSLDTSERACEDGGLRWGQRLCEADEGGFTILATDC